MIDRRCANCRHWRPEHPPYDPAALRWGVCERTRIEPGGPTDPESRALAVDLDSVWGAAVLRTGADFGCVQQEWPVSA